MTNFYQTNAQSGDHMQGHSQDYAKEGSEFSRPLLSTDRFTDKNLATKNDAHYPVYDYSHYIVKIKSLAMCAYWTLRAELAAVPAA